MIFGNLIDYLKKWKFYNSKSYFKYQLNISIKIIKIIPELLNFIEDNHLKLKNSF